MTDRPDERPIQDRGDRTGDRPDDRPDDRGDRPDAAAAERVVVGHVATSDPSTRPRIGLVTQIGGGRMMGVGGLPHRDADAAAAFSIGEFDLATVPSLPARSISEGLVAQAIGGLSGVALDPSGRLVIESPARVGLADGVDLSGDGFVGLRAFLDLASAIGHDGKPVKWQFVGPVTLGVALVEAGMPIAPAFELAIEVVRRHVDAIGVAVRCPLPGSEQIAILDEPSLADLMSPEFPIAPDEAVDLVSTAMAAADRAIVGVHCCRPCDAATLLASGPEILSVPADSSLVEWAGYIERFLLDDGVIAWGVVPTGGPVGPSSERYWNALADLWCALVERGVDATRLRRQSLITPTCGVSAHQVSVARRLARMTGEVARKVKDQAAATRFALGA